MTKLPNLLTLVRIFLVPFLVAALLQQDFRIHWRNRVLVANDFIALIVFLAAALTDLLDGYLARRWKQVTTVGTLLDPIADKLLVSAALISFVQIRLLLGWLVVLIISREFAVVWLAKHCGGRRLYHQSQRTRQVEDDIAGFGHYVGAAFHPLAVPASVRDFHDVGSGGFWHGVSGGIFCTLLEESG